MIYFILDTGTSHIKIGYTSGNPLARLRALQTGNPSNLVLLCATKGERSDEAKWHSVYADSRVNGEWFRPTDGLWWDIYLEAWKEGHNEGYEMARLRGPDDSGGVYRRVKFDTRLEQQWAVFFDLVGWKWSYKPSKVLRGELPAWHPEFEVVIPCGHSGCGSHVLLCAVRPFDCISKFRGHVCLDYAYGGSDEDRLPADAGAAFGNHPNVTYWEMSHGSGGGAESVPNWVPGDVEQIWRQAGIAAKYYRPAQTDLNDYKVGDLINHAVIGIGRVTALGRYPVATGASDSLTLTVDFPGRGACVLPPETVRRTVTRVGGTA